MKNVGGQLRLSASDLVGFLNCRHLIELEKAVAEGKLERPRFWDPALETLWLRGAQHEANYVGHLSGQDLKPYTVEGVDVSADAVAATEAAMRPGEAVIVQGALADGRWVGRADILRRIERPSSLGGWSYEVVDTKLARTTKGGTVLQLCLYSELLTEVQGVAPDHMYVVQPWTGFTPEVYRVSDFQAYYRRVKSGFEQALADGEQPTYPEPTLHCEICTWRHSCDHRRRQDDHLCQVAGISKLQIDELVSHGVTTMARLAEMPLPIDWKPKRGSPASYERIREQARLQVAARSTGELPFELLPHVDGFGLSQLPEPDAADIFLDFEGDPFVGDGGLEYLLGYSFVGDDGEVHYEPLWALNRADEKVAFERFIDFVMDRWARSPGVHIYHYGAYERSALTRLMGRYATREEELDQILRGKVLVDLLTVARQSVRAGVESYSIKKLEPLYGFERDTNLPDANLALTRLQVSLELDDIDAVTDEQRDVVQSYNRDDCNSTRALRDWLEVQRAAAIARGDVIERPQPHEPAPAESVAEWLAKIGPLVEALTDGVPVDPVERTEEQQAKWLLANLLDFHRREDKATWWELFRLSDLPADDLRDERAGLADLEFEARVGGTDQCPIHRYTFPSQESDIRAGKSLRSVGGAPFGTVEAVSSEALTIDVKKRKDTAAAHPQAVFVHEYVDPDPMKQALVRIAQYVVDHGLTGGGSYAAARQLLLRMAPAFSGPLQQEGETSLDAGMRIAPLLDTGVLPLQGPPGTGKTHTGAHMICELVRAGKRVGIVANSHPVIRNLLNGVVKAGGDLGIAVECVQKPKEREPDAHCLRFVTKNADLFAALAGPCQVAGGTAWLWACADAFESVDVLFVDEAAQMSLANVLAVSQAAKAIVLLGDPQQLDQPIQGSHPDGTAVSALAHILGEHQVIAPEQGLFLNETWRLHPKICRFTSELFYESKLSPRPDLAAQAIDSAALTGSGLRFIGVDHEGNTNCSPEEADVVAELVGKLLGGGSTWTDRAGTAKPLTLEDILIIAPYNAQVFEILERLPGARVGTVDKFQGQEAPIAIYSLATSSHAEAPRGMEFLYSAHRLNVATSRARCLSIIVASPQVFEADCRTPRQMQLANAFCRFLELAEG